MRTPNEEREMADRLGLSVEELRVQIALADTLLAEILDEEGKAPTPNEARFLAAVAASEYHDGNHPVGNHVWMDCVSGWEPQAKAGTVSSLLAKGFITVGGDRRDETVAITASGYAALTEAKQ